VKNQVRQTMQLYYIRHAQSENNALYPQVRNYEGRSMDPVLTATGRNQAELLALYLRKEAEKNDQQGDQLGSGYIGKFTHLYTSLMERAVATAEIIAGALELPLQAWEDLHETGGIFSYDSVTGEPAGQEGNNREYFKTHHPSLILPDSLGDVGWWNRPFESMGSRVARGRAVLRDLRQKHGCTNDRIAFVSHGGFYNYFIMAVLGLERRDGFWFLMNNTAITRFDFKEDETVLVYQNQTSHLPPDRVT